MGEAVRKMRENTGRPRVGGEYSDLNSDEIHLRDIFTLDDIIDGTTYSRVLTTDISAGHILLSKTVKIGEWYDESGVEIDASTGINIYGTNNALTTRATKTGTIQCYVGADGKLYAGAGAVWLDALGVHAKGIAPFLVYDVNAVRRGTIGGQSASGGYMQLSGDEAIYIGAVGWVQLSPGGDLIFAPTGKISAATRKIQDVVDPAANQDVATKKYVDDHAGSSTFLALTDTPASYSGQAGKYPKVNTGETALEFGTPSGGLSNIVEDTTPQLGGDLDVNDKKINSASGHGVTISAGATGTTPDTNNLRLESVDQTIIAATGNVHIVPGASSTVAITRGKLGSNLDLNGYTIPGLFVWLSTPIQVLSSSNMTSLTDYIDLDLSSYVPAGCTAVYLQLATKIDTIDTNVSAHGLIGVRKNGTTPDYPPQFRLWHCKEVSTSQYNYDHVFCGVDSNRVIEATYGIAFRTDGQEDFYIRLLGYI